MPLESLPDRFNSATHVELDRAVNKIASKLLPDSLTLRDHVSLLVFIAKHSNGDLHPKYTEHDEVLELIDAHEELMGMLSSAWEKKSYRDIRNLAILKARQPEQEPLPPTSTENLDDLHISLSSSFRAEYHGAAVDGFYEYLTRNENLFKTANCPSYYAKFCSIVQSSGTGKSRILTELVKKGVVVIYMNLRREDDVYGFPRRDSIPSKILTQFPETHFEYRTVCYAFFTALFDTVQEYLSTAQATGNAKANVVHWAHQMCDLSHPPDPAGRPHFFDKLYENYSKVHADLLQADQLQRKTTPNDPKTMDDKTESADVDKAADKLGQLTLGEANPTSGSSDFAARLFIAYERLGASLASIFPDKSDRPKLVIAVDEAHPLTPWQMHPPGKYQYRPADVFCRVVNGYSHHQNHAVWVVFASTTSKVADFSPPNQKHNSSRISIQGEKLFPPYTQLGWDQSAFGLGDVDVEDVSKIDHIMGYGRPLWVSLKNALRMPIRVLAATSKLCGESDFNPNDPGHVLAVLGQRFGLNVVFGHPDSIQHLETGVASHLRICLATSLDRNWRFTNYPSEPLLSCVAARKLHAQPTWLGLALNTLLRAVNSGMIDMGQRGELASRLLWLLGKDLFLRTQPGGVDDLPSTWEEHLLDCRMISVVDWLEFMFGPQVWHTGSIARNMFENAYVNFSHWVCMEANIAGSKEGNEIGLQEWTLRHWQRTSGVQCCHQQSLIDKMIPIYFKGKPNSGSPQSRMSHIFISDKARESKRSKDALHIITRRHKDLDSGHSDASSEPLPYIAILADLSQPSSFSVTFPERGVDDRCLRIYAAGVNTTTYPFLEHYPALMETLRGLVHVEHFPETETPFMQYLDAQVKFGSTATSQHMEWEHGKTIPDIRQAREHALWQRRTDGIGDCPAALCNCLYVVVAQRQIRNHGTSFQSLLFP